MLTCQAAIFTSSNIACAVTSSSAHKCHFRDVDHSHCSMMALFVNYNVTIKNNRVVSNAWAEKRRQRTSDLNKYSNPVFICKKQRFILQSLTVVSLCCGPGDWQCGPSSPRKIQSPDSIKEWAQKLWRQNFYFFLAWKAPQGERQYLNQLDDVSWPDNFRVILHMCLVGCQGHRGVNNALLSHEAGFNFMNTRGTRHPPHLRAKEEEQWTRKI